MTRRSKIKTKPFEGSEEKHGFMLEIIINNLGIFEIPILNKGNIRYIGKEKENIHNYDGFRIEPDIEIIIGNNQKKYLFVIEATSNFSKEATKNLRNQMYKYVGYFQKDKKYLYNKEINEFFVLGLTSSYWKIIEPHFLSGTMDRLRKNNLYKPKNTTFSLKY